MEKRPTPHPSLTARLSSQGEPGGKGEEEEKATAEVTVPLGPCFPPALWLCLSRRAGTQQSRTDTVSPEPGISHRVNGVPPSGGDS